MTYLVLMGLSWYATKFYYTRTFKLMPKEVSDSVTIICNHCSRQYTTAVENLRTSNYCGTCK
jgi:hypothetical protein